jgi:hypothetical protein
MKTSRRPEAAIGIPDAIELYDRRRDNLVRVENHAAGVVVRAAREIGSHAARSAFIRYLAAEGFIAERYQWCSDNSNHAALGISWFTDRSWVRFDHQRNRLVARARAFLARGRLLALGLFLLALGTALWLKGR